MKKVVLLALLLVSQAQAGTNALEYVATNFDVSIWQGDWMLTVWFYLNIVGYLLYCNFIATVTFSQNINTDETGYKAYRDTCVKGAYYEL